MALAKNRHKGESDRAKILAAVAQVRTRQSVSLTEALRQLGLCRASYYRYRTEPVPRPRGLCPRRADLLPEEKIAILQAARAYPLVGYKRLTWHLQNDFKAGVKAHETARVLREENLMGPRLSVPLELKRPAEPDRKDQVWHVDLMYVRVLGRWMYLVDVIDAYSRFLVHWTLNETMESVTVTLTIQEALEKHRPQSPPAIVHDSGSQFLSKEWKEFAQHHGMPSIRTRVAHPQSNGKVERLHRTHRTEALIDCSTWTAERANAELDGWADYYNQNRPHYALQGLPPVVYYLGDPEAALAQREHFVKEATRQRAKVAATKL